MISKLYRTQKDLEQSIHRLARAQAKARDRDAVNAALDAVHSRAVWQRLYSQSDHDPVSAQADDIRHALGVLTSGAVFTPLPVKKVGSVCVISTHVRLRMTASHLADALEGFSGAQRLLLIQSLSIVGPATQRPDTNEVLDVELDVAGFQASVP